MALLGKLFGALRSAAKCVFSSRQSSPKVEDVKVEHTEKKEEQERKPESIVEKAENPIQVPDPEQEPHRKKRTRPAAFVKKARLIEHNGEKKTAQEWAEELGVCTTAIRTRLRKYGSILAPDNSDKPIAKFKDIKLVKNENGTFIEADGKTYSLFQFSKVFGIKFGTLYGRVQKGRDIKEIINTPRDVKRDYTKAPPVKAKLWEWNGEKHTVGEWAKIYGVQKAMMRIRLTTYGSPERNTDKLESYKHRRARRFEWNGETHTAKEWAEIFKVPVRTMLGRLKAHNSPEAVRKKVCKPPPKQYKFNGESHTAEEWAEKTKQATRTVKKHFRENGTPYTTFKENSGHFKEKSYTWNGVTKRTSEWADEYNCTVNAIHKRFRKNGSPENTGGRRKAHYFTIEMPEEDAGSLVRHRNRAGVDTASEKMVYYAPKETVPEVAKTPCEEKTAQNATGHDTRHRPKGTLAAGLGQRSNRRGESLRQAFASSARKQVTFNGETHTYKEWGEKYGISSERMYIRIKRTGSPLPTEKPNPLPPPTPPKTKKEPVPVSDNSSSDDELYWCDGAYKTIAEWAEDYGLSKRVVKRNFEKYGTPIQPQYDFADVSEEEDYGEREEDIDAMLREIDKKQKSVVPKKQESIHEWLERIRNEPEDDRPLREILGCPRPSWSLFDKENGERKPTIFRGGKASRLDKASREMV